MKQLYHGTTFAFDKIDLNLGKGYKDFGKGFYATAVMQHAERIAKRNKNIIEKRQQVLRKQNPQYKFEPVTAYRYNLLYSEDTIGLKIKIFKEASVEWVKFIIKNRKSPVSMHDYDIVIGPTADAQTTLVLNQYEEDVEKSNYSNELCLQIISELEPENLPKQYFFGTEAALKTLQFDKIKRQVIL